MKNGKNNQRGITISVFDAAGDFAEDKDAARDMREQKILPAIKEGKLVVLEFDRVDAATQSFVHALISSAIRTYNGEALKLIEFRSCNKTVKSVILTVVEYSIDVMPNSNSS